MSITDEHPLLMKPEQAMRALQISRRSLHALVSDSLFEIAHPRPRLTRFRTSQVLEIARNGISPRPSDAVANLRNRKDKNAAR